MALTDPELLRGIKTNDHQTLDKIYKTYLPKISTMVIRNKGTKEEARDVFQEGLVVIFNKAQESDFEFTTGFYSYLYRVCKFIWLRQLKKKHRTEVTLEGDERLDDEETVESQLIETERRQFYKQKMMELTDECQQVLQSFFDGNSFKEIAQKMGYTREYVKRKKFVCKEKLVQLIKSDKRYSEFL